MRPQGDFVHICFINHPALLNFIINFSCGQTEIFVISALYCCGTMDKTLIIYHHMRIF